MLRFRGAPRTLKLPDREAARGASAHRAARCAAIDVEYVHFVDTDRELAPAERAVLERLLDFDAGARSRSRRASAVSRCRASGRSRPGRRRRPTSPTSAASTPCGASSAAGPGASRPAPRSRAGALAALAAPLFDPMTETLMLDAGEARRLFETHPRGALGHVALGARSARRARARRTRRRASRCRTARSPTSPTSSRASAATRPTSR